MRFCEAGLSYGVMQATDFDNHRLETAWPCSCLSQDEHGCARLEARVGIGQRPAQFQTSPKPFGSGDFSNCCTDKDIIRPKALNQANRHRLTPTNFNLRQHFWCPFWCPSAPEGGCWVAVFEGKPTVRIDQACSGFQGKFRKLNPRAKATR